MFRLLSNLSIFNMCASENNFYKNHLYCFLFQIIKCSTWTSLFHLDATRKMNSINLVFRKRHNRIQMSVSGIWWRRSWSHLPIAAPHCYDNITLGGNNINIDFYHLCYQMRDDWNLPNINISIYLLSSCSIESRTE